VNWGKRVILVAPHPDDEIIGVGGHLQAIRDLWVVHATDGAPKDMRDALRNGFATREEYARVRHREALAALRLAGVGPERCLPLEFPDQEVTLQLPELVRRLVSLFRGIRPDTVLAPSYEGGHPDHDAVAMAVHTAARIAAREAGRAPHIVEYTLYHAWEGRMRTGEFLPHNGAPVENLALEPAARVLKCRMMACFPTQQKTLAQFAADVERFRPAPAYDFSAPPHEGRLHYENFDWGMTGQQWRRNVREVLRGLEVRLSECPGV
jgi:N-acetylglucosamine malate deacetylase 2